MKNSNAYKKTVHNKGLLSLTNKEINMEKRLFGKTGIETSVLGFGGFHLCEIPYEKADQLLNAYLDKGGTYVETAPSYGKGESEIKIGRAIAHRRKEYTLVTKAHDREYETCKATFEQSLKNLKTDYVDVLLMHAVDSLETLDKILGEGGAIYAAEEAKREGKVKHIGISMHGQPDVLIEALKRYPFEAVMTTINYYDVCNFPKLLKELVPLAKEKGAAIILMKPLGDGYLYKSVEQAFNYVFNQDVSIVVTGMNTLQMLEKDFDMAENYITITDEWLEILFRDAVELGDYVCRQCGKCMPCPEGVDITGIFALEGIFDRQMTRGEVENSAEYALSERLKNWFGTQERAIKEYAEKEDDVSRCTGCGLCNSICPYGIDVIKKLKWVDYKLQPEFGRIWE